ncbi:type II secretion system protein [bacterium]|nr:type II secretion system protein [bacterium]
MKKVSAHNLLEVIIATVIFACAAVFMTVLWAQYHQAMTMNKNRMVAMSIARSEIESRINAGFTNLDPAQNSLITVGGFGQPAAVSNYTFQSRLRGRVVNTAFRATFTSQDLNTLVPPIPRLAHLKVVVQWNEKTGPPLSSFPAGTFGNMSVVYDANIFDGRQ